MYGCDLSIPIIFSVNLDIVQVYNDKNIKLLRKDLVEVSLEAC